MKRRLSISVKKCQLLILKQMLVESNNDKYGPYGMCAWFTWALSTLVVEEKITDEQYVTFTLGGLYKLGLTTGYAEKVTDIPTTLDDSYWFDRKDKAIRIKIIKARIKELTKSK